MSKRRPLNEYRLERALTRHFENVGRLHVCAGQGCAQDINREWVKDDGPNDRPARADRGQ